MKRKAKGGKMVKTAGRGGGGRQVGKARETQREKESRCGRKDNFGKRSHKSVTDATARAGV